MKNIGGTIKSLRQQQQMTLPALAMRAGLSKGSISKIENSEEANPSLATLYKIAEAMHVSLADILETERAQIQRIIPDNAPEWQKGLISYLESQGKHPDQNILNALYMLRNRKAAKAAGLETWKFLYQSIENSFKK